jgi:hypothetical protein
LASQVYINCIQERISQQFTASPQQDQTSS